MAAIKTKPTGYDKTSTAKIQRWKSLAINNADTLVTSFKTVFAVQLAKPASVTAWSASGGTITFTLGGSITGPVVVYGTY